MPYSLHKRDSPLEGMSTSKGPRRETSRFFEPPLSPPPTCPLPPPPVSPSPISSIRSHGTPSPRLPRLQISLLDLRSDGLNSSEHASNALKLSQTSLGGSSRLFNSFASPAKSPSIYGSPMTPYLARQSCDDSPINLLTRTDSRQMWWSQALTQASPTESPVPAPILQTPPMSNKARSKKDPQKAIAQCPVDVPSPSTSEMSKSEVVRSSTTFPTIAPLLQDELITSLPPWPYVNGVETYPQQRTICQRNEGGTVQRCSSSSMTYQDYAKIRISSNERISFCAVTNLEEQPATKDAGSVVDQLFEANAIEPSAWSWRQRHKRLIWIFITIAAVLMGTGGILVGVFWRLHQG